MQKAMSICFTIFFIISSILPVNKVAAEETQIMNLIKNGGFETTTNSSNWTNNVGPENWSVWIPSGNPVLTIDSDVYHERGKSISINASETSRADVLQDVAVKPDQNYQLSLWTKTENIEASSGGVFVRTQYLDSNNKKVSDGPSTEKIKGSNDWSLKKLNLVIPKSASKVRIELFFETAKGKAWFDDVTLRESVKMVTDFKLQENAVTLGIGETMTLTPIFTPADVTDKTVFWTSSNPDIAVINDTGHITGAAPGVTIIKATSKDGGFTAECLVSVDSAEAIESYEELRVNWFNKLTGNEQYNPNNQDAAAYIGSLGEKVTNDDGTGLWDSMNKSENSTSLWNDTASTTDSAKITTSYQRLKDMALAYSIGGSKLYGNQTLKADIVRGLDWLYTYRYNESKNEYGNWWDWEIGTPQVLNDIVVLLYNELSSTQINKYIRAIDRFVPDPAKRVSLSDPNFRETGANLLDKALVVSLRGVIEKNSAKVFQGRDSISKEYLYVNSGDGVFRDGSLIQHFNIAYTGGYGATWLGRTADMLYLLKDSPWEVKDPTVNNVFNWVTDSFEPLIYKGAMMDMVSGRGISRQSTNEHVTGRATILSLLRLADAAPPEKAIAIKRMIKEWIQTDTTFTNYANGLSIYQIHLVNSLMSDPTIEPRGELVKNQVFAGMDRVVHLRPGFGFGIGMFSDRISGFEYGNGENKKGWYTGAGATYLYNNDLKQFSNDFWPTVDSYRLPGTTTDQSKGTLKDWAGYYNPRTWVGGSNLNGKYGTAGMDFSLEKLTGSSLQGKKSWFMFDDEIVALGADISSTNESKVETIIENRQLNDHGDNKLIVNGKEKLNQLGDSETLNNVKWAHLEGNVQSSNIGYYFPESTSLYGLRESRTGSWNEINNGGSSESITRNYLSLAFDHGSKPTNASYSYVLLPNKDVTQTERYSSNPNISVLANTSAVQAVREKTLGITAANFFKAETVDFITVQSPASVMVQEDSKGLTLSVSDPTQKQDKVILELNKTGLDIDKKDETITVLQTSPTLKVEVNVAGSTGTTHSIKFKDKTAPIVKDPEILEFYRTDSVNVEFEISDSFSGVSSVEVKLDGVEVSNPIVMEPYSLSEGDHTIEITATDRAGNVTNKTYKLNIKMDIAHLDEAINFGREKEWIRDDEIASSLLSKVNNIQNGKIESKQSLNSLNSLENQIRAQSGKKIDTTFAKWLLGDISNLLNFSR
ncbi:polysaccharide lyase family 8 super-sandwich domain-containing protein [Paenibacillus sp. BSR1-1]|uniref:polysaccharide lyase family 8 super-sandwich domain-containing protein n=1 Tax=Paenibacillus sp. BSR1-1 TaxID=3020845 RepID=UPI0025B000A8|nr:polysaccharide lyase family 8 super-sandwich domain-containing protein [Paenibacillus sp. BSR1-1]MDN3018457.1 polysaccharide lyase family 8 super-sandwich domain-containing protein [Paenibacillus sp. BSR1-1]